ncbi:MAG: type II toxin-antitoxin system RelE/ParE family toxin [Chloroflexi bacterium]|nr:type II toxin-antitoxin system RelE/ParE family toxin [Chloroflexota bacterium]
MLYILFREAAGMRLMSLHGWDRERIADAIMLLADSPRPPKARRMKGRGNAYDIWVGKTRVLYQITRNGPEEDVAITILRIS